MSKLLSFHIVLFEKFLKQGVNFIRNVGAVKSNKSNQFVAKKKKSKKKNRFVAKFHN